MHSSPRNCKNQRFISNDAHSVDPGSVAPPNSGAPEARVCFIASNYVWFWLPRDLKPTNHHGCFAKLCMSCGADVAFWCGDGLVEWPRRRPVS